MSGTNKNGGMDLADTVYSGDFSPLVAACQVLHYFYCAPPLVRYQGNLRRQRAFIQSTGHVNTNTWRHS